MMMTAVIYRSC